MIFMTIRRMNFLIILAVLIVLIPLALVAYQGEAWWRILSIIIFLGCIFPLLAGLATRKVTAITQKARPSKAFLARALVGMISVFAVMVLATVLDSLSLKIAWERLSTFLLSYVAWVALIVIGMMYGLCGVLVNKKQKEKGG